jgi:hypothetical protein
VTGGKRGITGVPAVAFFKGDELVDTLIGAQDKNTLVDKTNAVSGQ